MACMCLVVPFLHCGAPYVSTPFTRACLKLPCPCTKRLMMGWCGAPQLPRPSVELAETATIATAERAVALARERDPELAVPSSGDRAMYHIPHDLNLMRSHEEEEEEGKEEDAPAAAASNSDGGDDEAAAPSVEPLCVHTAPGGASARNGLLPFVAATPSRSGSGGDNASGTESSVPTAAAAEEEEDEDEEDEGDEQPPEGDATPRLETALGGAAAEPTTSRLPSPWQSSRRHAVTVARVPQLPVCVDVVL